MPAMTEQEQIQLAKEMVTEPIDAIREAYQTAVRCWQEAGSSAEIQRWKTTLDIHRAALALREAIASLKV